MQISYSYIDTSTLPIVSTGVVHVGGKTGKHSVAVWLFDYGRAQGWSPAGHDMRGRALLDGECIANVVNPPRPDKVGKHIFDRPAGLSKSVSLKRLNECVEEAFRIAVHMWGKPIPALGKGAA